MSDRDTRAWLTSYRAALVLPVVAPAITDGAVLVQGDRIVWVGPRRDHPAAPNARVVELGHMVLTPGLVNAHTHLDLTVLRGLLDGLPFFGWIRAIVAARGQLTPDEWLDSARLGAIEALEAGVTTLADTSPTSASFAAMRELGLRGIAYLEVFGPDPAQVDDAMAGLRGRLDELRSRQTSLVRLGVSPHAPYSVSDALYAAAAAYARESGLPIATHVAESDAESDLVARGAGPFAELLRARGIAVSPRARTPVALLDRLGVLGDDALLIHCVTCDDADIAAICAKRAAVAFCPHSNRYFGHGDAAGVRAALQHAGGRVSVGTDSMASNIDMSPLREARAALGFAPSHTPFPAWLLATNFGANALGLSTAVGGLKVGLQADLAAFSVPPGTTDTTHVAVGPGASLVVVAGAERVRDGRLVGDAAAVRARVANSAQRLREWRLRALSL